MFCIHTKCLTLDSQKGKYDNKISTYYKDSDRNQKYVHNQRKI